MKTGPTAHEVAALAQVSQSAVSRAFTKGASVSPATREKVMAAAAALGYRPNAIASSPSQNPRPSATASVPVNSTVMFTCGANHTVNSRRAVP